MGTRPVTSTRSAPRRRSALPWVFLVFWVVVFGLVAALVLSLSTVYWGEVILAGVDALGRDLGGRTRSEAANVLREEWESRERAQRFDDLKVFLLDARGEAPFEETARRLGITLPALKSAVQKLRRRHRELFQEEIASTVTRPGEVEEEMRSLFAALGG